MQEGKLRLTYSGKISLEKGYANFFDVLKKITEYNTNLKIDFKIIEWYGRKAIKKNVKNFLQPASQMSH